MKLQLNTTTREELYRQAGESMAAWLPGWQDTYPSDPAVAVLEHLTWLSYIQNGLLDHVGEAHYRAYLELLGAVPRGNRPARITARGNAACWPGQRFALGGLSFEVTGFAQDTVILTQLETCSTMTELAPPFRLPQGWAGQRILVCFVPEADRWRQVEPLRIEKECIILENQEPLPELLRVVAVTPGFEAFYPLQGVAMEEVELKEAGIWKTSLKLMIEENGLWRDCPIDPFSEQETLEVGCHWNPAKNRLRFGNGRDIEPPGPGRLLICGCASTQGTKGNGAGGILQDTKGAALESIGTASGGMDRETAREAFFRTVQEQQQPLRAVTCKDYEVLARQLPGLKLAQVRALPRKALGETGPGVVVLAVPAGKEKEPALTPEQKQRLTAWLEPRRLLGVPVEVRSPRYGALDVKVVLTAREDLDEERLYRTVQTMTDGVEGEANMGASISYTALYAALERVPGVQTVQSLKLNPLDPGLHPSAEGGLHLEPDVLPRLREWELYKS